MKFKWTGLAATMVGVAIASTVLASVVYTEDFESGYTNGDNLSVYSSDWWASSSGVDSPVVEDGFGVAGSVGLGQHGRAVRWSKNAFDFSDPAITKVIMSADFETVWDTWTGGGSQPFDDDYLGWMVDEYSTSSSDIFGAYLEGNEIRTRWRHLGNSSYNSVIGTISDSWKYLTFYRLQVEYTKLTPTSLRMDVTVTELDENGVPGAVIGSATVQDTTSYGTKAPHAAQFSGPMWLGFKNYNQGSPGNIDNIRLEIIPEPATAILLAGAGLLLLKRRKRASS